MLAQAVRTITLDPRAKVLDVCSGSGAVAIAAAKRGVRSATTVDLHRASAWTARLNARLNGVRVRALHGDLFEPVAGERFDLITANPPYVPAPPGLAAEKGDRAWNAGRDGRAVVDRLIDQLPEHLTPDGRVLLVQSSVTGRGFTPAAIALATAFAYWCLPQIFFYALYSLLSEVLNARRIFGPFTWAPVLNNVVSIVGLVVFMLVFGASDANQRIADWDTGKIVLLAAVATAGVAAQALVLFLFWKRAGLRYRPDFHWRGVGLGATGKATGWLFGMVLVTQVAGVFQSKVASIASGKDASIFTLQNSWLIFMLPFSVIAVSIVTVYFTRMSGHGSSGDLAAIRSDLSEALRSIGLLIVFATVALSVVAYPFARLFTGRVSDMGNVILAFMPGLILYTVLFVIQRVFYSLGDYRTPFLLQCAQSGLFVVGALACGTLPKEWIAVGIAAVTTITFGIQAIIALILVRRRIGGIDGRRVVIRHLQYLGLALVSGAIGFLILLLLGGLSGDGFALSGLAPAIVSIAIVGLAMAAVYLGLLTLFRNPELASVTKTIAARFGR